MLQKRGRGDPDSNSDDTSRTGRGVVSATMADYSLYSRYSGTVSMHWPIVWIRASSPHNPVAQGSDKVRPVPKCSSAAATLGLEAPWLRNTNTAGPKMTRARCPKRPRPPWHSAAWPSLTSVATHISALKRPQSSRGNTKERCERLPSMIDKAWRQRNSALH